MTTSHQVTKIRPDGADRDRRIDKIGGDKGGKDGGAWSITIDRAIEGMKDGSWSFWTLVNGQRVDVVIAKRQNGREYLKTTADDYEPNNLLALPKTA